MWSARKQSFDPTTVRWSPRCASSEMPRMRAITLDISCRYGLKEFSRVDDQEGMRPACVKTWLGGKIFEVCGHVLPMSRTIQSSLHIVGLWQRICRWPNHRPILETLVALVFRFLVVQLPLMDAVLPAPNLVGVRWRTLAMKPLTVVGQQLCSRVQHCVLTSI